MKLGGELIGYEIHKKNGIIIHHEYKKPIKNMVTKHCLNNLLMYNGTNDLGDAISGAALFVSTDGGTRTGVFNYCAYGSGAGAGSTDDDDLETRLVEQTSTKKQSGTYYNCGRLCTDDKTIKFRITHTFPASDTSANINEIGWFHRIEPDGVFTMSSRVVLDNTIIIEAGDIFECTYQFCILFDWEPTIIKNFFTGFDVRKGPNLSGGTYDTWTNDGYFPFPGHINSTGKGTYFWKSSSSGINGSERGVTAKQPVYCIDKEVRAYYRYQSSFGPTIAPILSSFNLPTNFTNPYNANVNNYLSMCNLQIKNYTLNSFYREYVIICNDVWCDDLDVYGIAYNGEIYQFGHEVDGEFTPAPIHKNAGKNWTFTFRQSWSTDLLQPVYP